MSTVLPEQSEEAIESQGDLEDCWCRVLTESGPICMPMSHLMSPPSKNRPNPSKEDRHKFVSEMMQRLDSCRSGAHANPNANPHRPFGAPSPISYDPKDGFLPIFGKDSYLSYREKFMQIYPFDDCLGKKNPYTGTTVSTQSDYEVYCVSRYLKYVAEEEIIDLQAKYQLQKEENVSLQSRIKKFQKKTNILLTIICFLSVISFILFVYFCVTI